MTGVEFYKDINFFGGGRHQCIDSPLELIINNIDNRPTRAYLGELKLQLSPPFVTREELVTKLISVNELTYEKINLIKMMIPELSNTVSKLQTALRQVLLNEVD